LNLIGALDKPTEGKVLLRGIDISTLNDDELADLRNREIGFVFQFFNLIPRMTALKNVELPMSFASVSSTQRKKRASELLEMVGLGDRLDHKPTELSGGEQQRVAIARALVNNPAIVLCDEPTGNVDTKTGIEIMNILRRLNEEEEKSFIIVTHDPNIANSTHRIMNMQDGKITRDQIMMTMQDGIVTRNR
jgi:putative ABC transport system ATP-binding protein